MSKMRIWWGDHVNNHPGNVAAMIIVLFFAVGLLLLWSVDEAPSVPMTQAEIARQTQVEQALRSAKSGDFIITLSGQTFAIREVRNGVVYFYQSRFAPVYDYVTIDKLVRDVARVIGYDDTDYKAVARCYVRGRPLANAVDPANPVDPCQK